MCTRECSNDGTSWDIICLIKLVIKIDHFVRNQSSKYPNRPEYTPSIFPSTNKEM